MPKKWSVRVNRNDDGLIKHVEDMLAQHKKEGSNSGLIGFDTVAMLEKLNKAKAEIDASRRKRDESAVATQNKDLILGKAKGQSSSTEDTLLWYVYSAKSMLMGKYRGKERKLGLYGLDVRPTRSYLNQLEQDHEASEEQSSANDLPGDTEHKNPVDNSTGLSSQD